MLVEVKWATHLSVHPRWLSCTGDLSISSGVLSAILAGEKVPLLVGWPRPVWAPQFLRHPPHIPPRSPRLQAAQKCPRLPAGSLGFSHPPAAWSDGTADTLSGARGSPRTARASPGSSRKTCVCSTAVEDTADRGCKFGSRFRTPFLETCCPVVCLFASLLLRTLEVVGSKVPVVHAEESYIPSVKADRTKVRRREISFRSRPNCLWQQDQHF